MEMEVMMPSPAPEFNFDSACTTPYISAPSSPQRFGTFFYSAPASPTRVSAGAGGCRAAFDWEVESKSGGDYDGGFDDDFAFDFSGQLEKSSFSAADELFDGGKIKPLNPKSPRSPKQFIKEAFLPRRRRENRDFDPFKAVMEQSKIDDDDCDQSSSSIQQRGRHRDSGSTPTRHHKATRSLSPLRVSDLLLEGDEENRDSSSPSVTSFISDWYRKWKLKDLFLFRSASEGRASSKEMMMKSYAMLKKGHQRDEVKNSSFRSTESVGSSSSARRRGGVSAHFEQHYAAKRAAAEEMKRKTFLPYKQGLLGCLGFNPMTAPPPEISKGLAAMSMPRRS